MLMPQIWQYVIIVTANSTWAFSCKGMNLLNVYLEYHVTTERYNLSCLKIAQVPNLSLANIAFIVKYSPGFLHGG